jgi:hypothetical protein
LCYCLSLFSSILAPFLFIPPSPYLHPFFFLTIPAQGPGTWDRITFQGGANGAIYHIDNIVVVESIIVAPLFLSAEPFAANTVAVTTQGAVDFSTVGVSLNGQVRVVLVFAFNWVRRSDTLCADVMCRR